MAWSCVATSRALSRVLVLLLMSAWYTSRSLPTGQHSDGVSSGLEEMTKYYETETGTLCPTPRAAEDTRPEVNLCHAPPCTTDANCTDPQHNCCFNGCVRTCQTWISPPLALDWIEEPQYIYNSSDGDETSTEASGFLPCSTTVRSIPSKILGCPEGYKCQIYEVGDPVTGRLNKGICLTDQTLDAEPFNDELHGTHQGFSKKERIILPGGCLLTAIQYNDLEDFLKGGHYVSWPDQSLVRCDKTTADFRKRELPDSKFSRTPSAFQLSTTKLSTLSSCTTSNGTNTTQKPLQTSRSPW